MDLFPQTKETKHSASDIKFPDRHHLFTVEERDIHVLNTYVAPLYQPRQSPVSLIVGYSSLREAEILRSFHEDSFGIAHPTSKVIGCNIVERRGAGTTDSLDQLYMGHFAGDAKDSYTWLKGFMALDIRGRLSYDIAYIRNPDLYSVRDWSAIFARAVEMTATSGVVITLIREDDVASFKRLTAYLETKYGIRPELVTETAMSLEDDPLRQHFLLGVFRGSARCDTSGARNAGRS